jgi:Glycosyl hydrolases family 25/Putative peptidoglycan binding domain
MTNTVQGDDFASVDENPTPDEGRMQSAGQRFVIIRKSYGFYDGGHKAFRLAPDGAYESNAAGVRSAGMVLGSYLFPVIHADAPSPAEQVANFVQAAGDIQPFKDLPPTLDVEFPGNGISDTGLTQGAAYSMILGFVTELKKAFGVEPIIYTSHVEWCDTNGLGGPADLGGHDCPLWIKIPYHLAAHRAPDTSPAIAPHVGASAWDRADLFRIPPPWEKSGWWIRQFQGDAWGLPGVHQADLDDFQLLLVDSMSVAGDGRMQWVGRRLGLGPNATENEAHDALLAFQEKHGLAADGVVGPATFAALAWTPV